MGCHAGTVQRRVLLPAIAAAATAAVAVWTAWLEPRRTVVRRRTLHPPGWPPALDGLRVALLGDLHAGAPHVDAARVRRVVQELGAEVPDVALVAGDLVDHEVAGARPVPAGVVAGQVAALRAPLGTFAVLGNHDRAHGAGVVSDALRRHGIDVLEDDARRIVHRGAGLWIAGAGGRRDEPESVLPALTAVPDDEPVLLLVHEPDVFPTVPHGVALTFAGHTHGGQVALPGLRAAWTPSRFGERYARRGHHVEDGRHLFVTAGVGTSRFPLRLGAPPEVVLLVLRSGAP